MVQIRIKPELSKIKTSRYLKNVTAVQKRREKVQLQGAFLFICSSKEFIAFTHHSRALTAEQSKDLDTKRRKKKGAATFSSMVRSRYSSSSGQPWKEFENSSKITAHATPSLHSVQTPKTGTLQWYVFSVIYSQQSFPKAQDAFPAVKFKVRSYLAAPTLIRLDHRPPQRQLFPPLLDPSSRWYLPPSSPLDEYFLPTGIHYPPRLALAAVDVQDFAVAALALASAQDPQSPCGGQIRPRPCGPPRSGSPGCARASASSRRSCRRSSCPSPWSRRAASTTDQVNVLEASAFISLLQPLTQQHLWMMVELHFDGWNVVEWSHFFGGGELINHKTQSILRKHGSVFLGGRYLNKSSLARPKIYSSDCELRCWGAKKQNTQRFWADADARYFLWMGKSAVRSAHGKRNERETSASKVLLEIRTFFVQWPAAEKKNLNWLNCVFENISLYSKIKYIPPRRKIWPNRAFCKVSHPEENYERENGWHDQRLISNCCPNNMNNSHSSRTCNIAHLISGKKYIRLIVHYLQIRFFNTFWPNPF